MRISKFTKGVALAVYCCGVLLHADTRPKTRLAHVGLQLDGAWGFMKQELAEPEAELVAVADPHPDLIQKAKGALPASTKFFADYVKMLDQVKPDAVIATLPNSEHIDLVRACARRHVHLWFQKPMATSLEDAKEMERLAKDAGVLLMINYWTMWEPARQTLTAAVKAGAIGPVQRMIMRNSFPASKDAAHGRQSVYYFNYFHDVTLHGGGAIMDQGTYGIDYALWLLGKPSRVFALGKNLRNLENLTAEDEGWVILDYPKATVVLWAGWWILPDDTPGVTGVMLVGPNGMLQEIQGKVLLTRAADADKHVEPVAGPEPLPVAAVPRERANGIAHFIDCIRNGKTIDAPHTPALNVVVHEVVEAAYQSIRIGQAVALKP